MARTSFDAYRIGDILGPGVAIFNSTQVLVKRIGGADWVEGPGQGGSSMRLRSYPLKDPNMCWWFLPAGRYHPDTVNLVADGKKHASWEPVRDMLLTDYVDDLRQILGWQKVP
jgi:hypothetical protein